MTIQASRLELSSCRVAILLFVLLLRFPAAFAAGPIDTDGPDFVDSSEVVGKGRFQFETDVIYDRNKPNSAYRKTITTPTLFKYGVTDALELRLDTVVWNRSTMDLNGGIRATETGPGETALSVKWHAQDRDSSTGVPAVSWIFDALVPSGSDYFKGHGVRPSLRSVITWDLPHDFGLALMPGLEYDAASDGRRFSSGMLGINFAKRWSESFRTFVESSSTQIAHRRDGGVLSYWDVGAAYLLNNDWQLGFRVGIPANRNTPDGYLLFELAGRF